MRTKGFSVCVTPVDQVSCAGPHSAMPNGYHWVPRGQWVPAQSGHSSQPVSPGSLDHLGTESQTREDDNRDRYKRSSTTEKMIRKKRRWSAFSDAEWVPAQSGHSSYPSFPGSLNHGDTEGKDRERTGTEKKRGGQGSWKKGEQESRPARRATPHGPLSSLPLSSLSFAPLFSVSPWFLFRMTRL